MRRLPSLIAVALVGIASVAAGCRSSESSSSNITAIVTTTTPSATIPEALRPICALLAEATPIDGVQPTNRADWTVERARVVQVATADAQTYRRAAEIAPAELAAQLPKMAAYATAIADATNAAATFSAATSAIGSYPDKVGASLAMSTVESWKRTNCK